MNIIVVLEESEDNWKYMYIGQCVKCSIKGK